MENKNPNPSSYLFIKLNEKIFALNGQKVLEVTEVPNMIKVPGAPEFIRGIVMYDKKYIPVVDLSLKLKMHKTDFTVNTCLLIYVDNFHNNLFQAGILADAIHEIKENRMNEGVLEHNVIFNDYAFDAVHKEDGNNCLIINMETIFSAEEVTAVSSILSSAAL